jgi:hypothetical protein
VSKMVLPRLIGQKRTVIVIFHQGLYERQLSTLHGRIDKVRREVEERFANEESKERYRHERRYFLIAFGSIEESLRKR